MKSSKGTKLLIGRSKPDFVRKRNWAMRQSEKLIRDKLTTHSMQKEVKFVKSKELRKIVVDGADAFVQLQTDSLGSFVQDFNDLSLE